MAALRSSRSYGTDDEDGPTRYGKTISHGGDGNRDAVVWLGTVSSSWADNSIRVCVVFAIAIQLLDRTERREVIMNHPVIAAADSDDLRMRIVVAAVPGTSGTTSKNCHSRRRRISDNWFRGKRPTSNQVPSAPLGDRSSVGISGTNSTVRDNDL